MTHAQVKIGKITKPVGKMLLETLGRVDPKTEFICVLSDRNLGPFADATIIVPWHTRERVQDDALRELHRDAASTREL